MSETGKTIVITWPIGGFGAAAVRAFADRGHRIWSTMRTVVGITGGTCGVDQINAYTQHRQDALLKAMQLDTVLC